MEMATYYLFIFCELLKCFLWPLLLEWEKRLLEERKGELGMRVSFLPRGTLSSGSEWCVLSSPFNSVSSQRDKHEHYMQMFLHCVCAHIHTCRYAHITYIHSAFFMPSSLMSASWALHTLSCSVLWFREYSVSAGQVFFSPDWLRPQCLGAYFQPPNQSFRIGRVLFCSAFMHVFHRQLKKKKKNLSVEISIPGFIIFSVMCDRFFSPPVWISSFLHII